MSDDQSDAEFEASLANLDDGSEDASDGSEDASDGSHVGPAALDPAELPSVVGRLESVRSTLSTLGMRIDALVTSTTSYRSALTDRLTEYSELVTKATRAQATDLDDYRKTAERAVTEVRRSVQATEESMQRISSRLDDLASGDGGEENRRVVAEVRSILDAQERLSDFLTEALDRFGSTVVERIDHSQEGLTGDLEALRTAVDAAAADQSALTGLRAEVAALGDAIDAAVGERLDRSHEGLVTALDGLPGVIGAGAEERLARFQEGLSAAVGELTGRVESLASDGALTTALRVDLGNLHEQVSGLRDEISALGSADPAAQVRADLEPLRSGLDRVEARLADTAEHDVVLNRIDGLTQVVQGLAAGDDDGETEAINRLLGELQITMLDVASGEVVGALWDEVRGLRGLLDTVAAHAAQAAESGADDVAAEALAAIRTTLETARDEARSADAATAESVEALRSAVDALGSEVRTSESSASQGLEGVRSALASLVDEVRSDDAAAQGFDTVRSSVDALATEVRALLDSVEVLADEPPADPAGDLADDPADDRPAPATAEQLTELVEEVRSLRDQIRAETADDTPDDTMASILDQVTSLRDELAEGLVIEPSESISGTLTDLQATVAGLQEAIEQRPTGEDGDDGDDERDDVTVSALDALRAAIDELHARFDEGLVLADEPGAHAPGADAPSPVSAEQFADQIAALRDLISTEMAAVQDRIGVLSTGQDTATDEIELTVDVGPFEDAVNALRDEVRSMVTTTTGDADGPTGIDADTVDLFREEIRAAGGVADQVVDALRDELKALRRRLAVKADEKVLDDDQLAQIAEAVAQRLERS